MQKIIFITGPTATGKTEVSFHLAKKLNAEIVSCDSMLVYKEPRIITSKPPEEIREEVKHHFIDIVSVEQTYDVFTYYTDATAVIKDLSAKDIPVIVCGGTGLYLEALLDGIFEGPSRDDSLRAELQKEAETKGNNYLYQKLQDADPQAAEKISPNDLKRIIRALEVYYLSGIPISQKQKERKGLWGSYNIKIFGLTRERGELYERINERTRQMFSQGVVREVKRLIKLNLSISARKIIGIEEIKGALEEKYSLEEAQDVMSKNTRNFAKRQLTWFRKEKRIEWVNIHSRAIGVVVQGILDKLISDG